MLLTCTCIVYASIYGCGHSGDLVLCALQQMPSMLHMLCYAQALSLCHALIFFSVLPLCVPPVRFSIPYQTTLAVATISMFSRYCFLLRWYCSPTASPSSLGHARPLCFPITVTVSHAHAASLLVPSSILSCTHESVLVRFLQTLFIPSHYFTALQSAYF